MKLVEEYNLKYNFGKYQNKIKEYLNFVLDESTDYFKVQYQEGKLNNIETEFASMLNYITNIEEYLFYNFNMCPRDFESIFKEVSKIKKISVLPKNERGIYGKAISSESSVLINPNLSGNGILNSSERTRLYVAHELG